MQLLLINNVSVARSQSADTYLDILHIGIIIYWYPQPHKKILVTVHKFCLHAPSFG